MSILNSLSSVKGEKGSKANVLAAKQIAETNNCEAIAELVLNLKNNDKRIQSDCIKTLYEIAYLNPELIFEYYDSFLQLLESKNNRLVWGSMIALMTIVDFKHKELFESLDLIIRTIHSGSVITVDCGVGILAGLTKYDAYFKVTDPLLYDLLWNCPVKQLPQYLERSLIAINLNNTEAYISLIEKRLAETESPGQKKRMEKVLKRIKDI